MTSYRIGAIFFFLWGVMHVAFGIQILSMKSNGATIDVIDAIYLDDGPVKTPRELGSVVHSLMNQHAWNLLWFGVVSTIVGIFFNWRNSVAGYWANMIVVGAADIGFIVAVLVPGYASIAIGIWGPVLWILGAVFSTIGMLKRKRS